jgi:hypothetical protein
LGGTHFTDRYMTWRPGIGVFLCMTLGLASALGAQSIHRQVRFLTDSDGGIRKWQGYVTELTPDSLRLRVGGSDSIVVFSRSAIRSVEREPPDRSERAAGVGCLIGGGVLGALGYFGTHDPDSPGLEKQVGVLALVVGCAVGGVGGLIVDAVQPKSWEAWVLPDSIPSSVPSNGALHQTGKTR